MPDRARPQLQSLMPIYCPSGHSPSSHQLLSSSIWFGIRSELKTHRRFVSRFLCREDRMRKLGVCSRARRGILHNSTPWYIRPQQRRTSNFDSTPGKLARSSNPKLALRLRSTLSVHRSHSSEPSRCSNHNRTSPLAQDIHSRWQS